MKLQDTTIYTIYQPLLVKRKYKNASNCVDGGLCLRDSSLIVEIEQEKIPRSLTVAICKQKICVNHTHSFNYNKEYAGTPSRATFYQDKAHA